jgi:hypothetical protein
VAATALGLWGLCASDADSVTQEHVSRAAAFLASHHQEDGGIYAADRGLAIYTSGVSAQALREAQRRFPALEFVGLQRQVELYAYQRRAPESWADEAERGLRSRPVDHELALELLERDDLDEAQRRAVEFVLESRPRGALPAGRLRMPGHTVSSDSQSPFSYDDLLPLVYETLRPEHQRTQRAIQAIRADYTMLRNPDLTKRYGGGYEGGGQGLYYYYCTLGRVLAAHRTPVLRLDDGSRHDWPRELSRRLLELQREDGSWVNEDGRWWEDEPILVTAYAILALRSCLDVPSR